MAEVPAPVAGRIEIGSGSCERHPWASIGLGNMTVDCAFRLMRWLAAVVLASATLTGCYLSHEIGDGAVLFRDAATRVHVRSIRDVDIFGLCAACASCGSPEASWVAWVRH